MIFSNRHGFHYMQILQNATALPAYIYRETNNKARINRKRHALSKQYWLKKNGLKNTGPTQNHQTQPAQTNFTQQDAHKQNTATQDFIPPPFPEKREPVIINSRARRKPAVSTAQTPIKPKRTSQENSPTHQPNQFTWKPGRGAVERIDKYSGEIFHLVDNA